MLPMYIFLYIFNIVIIIWQRPDVSIIFKMPRDGGLKSLKYHFFFCHHYMIFFFLHNEYNVYEHKHLYCNLADLDLLHLVVLCIMIVFPFTVLLLSE